MAQAYTAPDWTSGEGISPSNLQSISNTLEGIIQGTDRAMHNVDINGSNLIVTYVDGTIENFAISGLKGIANVSKRSSGAVDTYTITYTDGSTYSFSVRNGSGSTAEEIVYDNSTSGIAADNVQSAIDSVFTSVSNGKSLVASAITDKGVETLATDSFQTMADNIGRISSGQTPPFMSVTKWWEDGNRTYTITEDGLYAIIVLNPYQGSSSINIVSENTPILNEYVSDNRTDGLRLNLVNLNIGDVVNVNITHNTTYKASFIIITKLNVNINHKHYGVFKKDAVLTLNTTLEDNKDYLIIGACGSRTGTQRDDTQYNFKPAIHQSLSNLTLVTFQYGKKDDLIIPTMYGYDGSGVGYYVLDYEEI